MDTQNRKYITKNITESALKDALQVCQSMHSLNAPQAVGYLFCVGLDEESVLRGMFFNDSPWDKDEKSGERWDGFIDFRTQTLEDLISGEVIKISS